MTEQSNRREVILQLFIFSAFIAAATYLFAIFHPYSRPVDIAAPFLITAVHAWVFCQAFALVVPGLLAGSLVCLYNPRLGRYLGFLLITAGGLSYLLDAIAFNGFHERLYSTTTLRILIDLTPGLVTYLTPRMIFLGGAIVASLLLVVVILWLSAYKVAQKILNDGRESSNWHACAIVVALVGSAIALPAWQGKETLAWMRASSDRQPIFTTGWFRHRDQGVGSPIGKDRMESSVRALAMAPKIHELTKAYSQLSVIDKPSNPPDILLVVIESLRHETINAKSSPNLHALANRGTWCKRHFSSCNATNMGMFSMFYGMESVWFEKGVHWEPGIIKLLRSVGYRTGFFGGSMHWDTFGMHTFVNSQLFDEFEISPVEWEKSDARMCEMAADFLDDGDSKSDQARPPKFAVLYLYSTHFDYRSGSEDQVHEPFVDGELSGGYTEGERDAVWNRYLNSVHCVDRLLEPLLTDDRLIMVVGDHGEAFLEDQCRLHGVRISQYQNMTPAIFAGPGIAHREVSFVTSHTDVLPTLLDASGISISNERLLEGRSIIQMDGNEDRLMVTRNYMRPEIAILADRSESLGNLLGYRCFFSMAAWEAYAANPIDNEGFELPLTSTTESKAKCEAVFSDWLLSRFGKEVATRPTAIAESLATLLQSQDEAVLVVALSLASGVDDDDIEIILPLVSKATLSPIKSVRERASSTLITLQRRLN